MNSRIQQFNGQEMKKRLKLRGVSVDVSLSKHDVAVMSTEFDTRSYKIL